MGYEELFLFAGGLGMFIYGMQIMSQGLENAAGNKMKSLLEVLTKNKCSFIIISQSEQFFCIVNGGNYYENSR